MNKTSPPSSPGALATETIATPAPNLTPPAAPEATPATTPSVGDVGAGRKPKRKRKTLEDAAKQYRNIGFAHVPEEDVWTSERGGWAAVPRPIGMIAANVIGAAHKKMFQKTCAAGSTYLTLWLRAQGSGVSRIESEADAAFEAGYGGQRGITTFRQHMRALKSLGFIDYIEENRGRIKWVLLLNPYRVVKKLFDGGHIELATYLAVTERSNAIGVGDEFDDQPEMDDGAE
ncbi:hypothetical protein ISF41_22435 [Burkholderia pseudomallei]|nr:hypothetical protein [Burkholderia pseudomallei]